MIQVGASLAMHFVLLASVVAAGAVAFRRVSGGSLLPLCAGFVASGVLAYATGIAWFASPAVGLWVSRAVPAACVAYVVATWWRERDLVRRTLGTLVVPGVLTALWAAFDLAMGFLYGGQDDPAEVSASRFSHLLPMDNQLPYLVARHVEQVGHLRPPIRFGDWLSSDRPPLQSAFFLEHTLWQKPEASAQLDLQVLATLLQSTWVVGVWVLALVLTTRRSVRALMIAGSAACGQVLLNSFYTWPKLLAAAFALVAVALVLRRNTMPDGVRLPLAATAATLGYLSHGGVIFVLIPVAALAISQLVRRGRALRVGGLAVGSAVLLLAPWFLYQRLYDPPGDRLLKWMLADVYDIDRRSVMQTVADRYGGLGIGDVFRNKIGNVEQVVGLPLQQIPLQASNGFDAAIPFLRGTWFFELIPSFGLLLVLLLGLVAVRRAPAGERGAQLALAALWIAGVLAWCVLLFGPRTTLTHQGTYAFTLIGIMLLVGAGAMASIRWTTVVVCLQALLTLVVYVPLIADPEVEWTQTAHVAKQGVVVAVGSAAALVFVLVAYARGADAVLPRWALRGPWLGELLADIAPAMVIGAVVAAAKENPTIVTDVEAMSATDGAAIETVTTGPEASLDTN